jgi:hypothetical protein
VNAGLPWLMPRRQAQLVQLHAYRVQLAASGGI